MLFDEEGLLKGNEAILIGSHLYGVDQHGQRIVGNVLFVTDVYEGDGISFTGIEPETFENEHSNNGSNAAGSHTAGFHTAGDY